MGRLFWKFFLSILLAQLAATIGIGAAFWVRDQARQEAAASAIDGSGPAEMLVESASATLKFGGPAGLAALLREVRHEVFALDENGKDLLGRAVLPALRQHAEEELANGAPGRVVRRVSAADGHQYTLFVPRSDSRRMRGGLGGPSPAGGRGPGLHPLHQLAPVAGATVASFLFAALLAWYFSRRIRALRDAFEAASAGDLHPRFADTAGRGGDELSELGHDFDRMSARLSALLDGQRRLLHDVSHELRSPLARLQAAIGLAHQQPEKIGASLDRIEREGVRMDKLVGELLTLSRLEAAAPVSMNEDIVIRELVEEIVSDARFEAGETALGFIVSGEAGALVRGAPDLLWSAIENVVRNAIVHGGGHVEVDLAASPANVRISVHDRGPGVPATALHAIFEPFFRANDGLAPAQGHGLGLAIAHRVLTAHGGSIVAANRPGGGLSVTITLPLASGARPT